MKIHVQKSGESATSRAVEDVVTALKAELQGLKPDLLFLFVTHHHEESFPTISGQIQQQLEAAHLIGCTAEAVLANNEELESQPGIVVWSLSGASAEIKPFHLQFQRESEQIVCTGYPELGEVQEKSGAVFLFCEPYSTAPQLALSRLAELTPGLPVFGGVASGGIGPGESCLFLNGELLEHGAVGVSFAGSHRVRPLVSQGCRPIGHTFVVTKTEKNIIYELGGLPAMQQFRQMFQTLSPEDQELVRQGPHLGVVTNEYKEHFERGDFLVSNVLGSDPESGAIAVSQQVRAGRTVQFHVRDAGTATEDLKLMIQQDQQARGSKILGGLVFTCNGRGEKLFGQKHHDASALHQAYGEVPLAGFFAQGEIGPLGDRSFLHGFTASVALFEE